MIQILTPVFVSVYFNRECVYYLIPQIMSDILNTLHWTIFIISFRFNFSESKNVYLK